MSRSFKKGLAVAAVAALGSFTALALVARRPPDAPTSAAADLPAASPPRLHAEPTRPDPLATPEARAANLIEHWRTSIQKRDPEGVLTCDRIFRDEPALYAARLVELAEKDSDERVRAFSTRVLGKLTDGNLGPVFLRLLGDASSYVRSNAAWALGQLSPELGVTALERVRQRDRDEAVRKSASEALARLRQPGDKRGGAH